MAAAPACLRLELPWPPSGNMAWRMARGHWHPSAEYKAFVAEVALRVRAARAALGIEHDLTLVLDLNPPDRRRRDIDNVIKTVGDSLTKAGVWADDFQVRLIVAHRADPAPPRGRVVARVLPYPPPVADTEPGLGLPT